LKETTEVAELLIRAGHDDHLVIGDLLTPGGAVALRPPIDRLVADAQTAARLPSLAESAHLAGVPYLVDPVTYLLQGPTDPEDAWVRRVPFGESGELLPSDFSSARIEALAAEVVEFELKQRATAIVAPYLYAHSPEDPAFTIALQLLVATRRHMSRNSVNLPLIAVFCGGWKHFAREDAWGKGVDRFLANALDVQPQSLAMCLTPVGAASDGYAKTARIFLTGRRFRGSGVPTFAWRQGTFGPGLVAAGLAGYETGACTREHADVRSQITRKKPKANGKRTQGGPPRMVYLEGLGRSVTLDVARALLGDLDSRARLICDDESCCQHGVDSMLDDRVRHTINARARRIRDLNAMPESAWRLHQITKDAEQAVRTIKRASLTLRRLGVATKLESGAQESLARIADHLRQQDAHRETA
jgi:hypothetical protein